MNRKPTGPPLETWQFYSAALYHLGMSTLNKLYTGLRSKGCPSCGAQLEESRERQIHRWASDPATTASHQHNPVDRYESLLKKLMERGAVDVARSVVARQIRIVRPHDMPEPGCDTIAEECLDDYPAVLAYHDALRDPSASREEVDHAMEQAITELKQNRTLRYRQEGWVE
ncbi:MAG: hypothetical protein ABIL58_23425 [Pseudomonadota bacterium]